MRGSETAEAGRGHDPQLVPLVLFEDEHLLVVNKPPGWNTHAPSPYAGEGIYDWLRHREPRWASLAIIHRLDKETSGILIFGKTPLANRSLTEQFTRRTVRKQYVFLTDRDVSSGVLTVRSALRRTGERYVVQTDVGAGPLAETRFRVLKIVGNQRLVEAVPLTGRTHQIRAHAADRGFPVLGDVLYGGTPAARVCLHAQRLTVQHPATRQLMEFAAPAAFSRKPQAALRAAIFEPSQTNAFRWVHGAADGWPGWYVDRLGDYLLSQAARSLHPEEGRQLAQWLTELGLRGAYHKLLSRSVRERAMSSPQHVIGEGAGGPFLIRENGVTFELSFQEGYSVGLFLDQRGNRRRFLLNHVAADFPISPHGLTGTEVLNTFAYTCGFSVCAALAGARVTSVDLSRKNLAWGQRNFQRNGIEPANHRFLQGDVFDWLRRLGKKQRTFDAVILDPPTFSSAKRHGVFQAEKDYAALIRAVLPLVKPRGVLFAATNAATLTAEQFLGQVAAALEGCRRRVLQRHYAPQPPDFPIARAEPGHLKTVWLRVV